MNGCPHPNPFIHAYMIKAGGKRVGVAYCPQCHRRDVTVPLQAADDVVYIKADDETDA